MPAAAASGGSRKKIAAPGAARLTAQPIPRDRARQPCQAGEGRDDGGNIDGGSSGFGKRAPEVARPEQTYAHLAKEAEDGRVDESGPYCG